MSNAESAARPAVVPTTPEVIVEHLRGLIHRGEVGPGDRLPPERTLAEQLGVARVSYGPMPQRVALTALQELVEDVHAGGGVPSSMRALN